MVIVLQISKILISIHAPARGATQEGMELQ